METTNNSRMMYNLALLTTLLSVILIGLGAFLSSSGYSQAIPTWPLANGKLIPDQLVGGILWEFIHRATAAITGIVALLASVWIATRDPRGGVQKMAWGTAGLMLFQILIGGMGAMTGFPVWVMIAHAIGSGLFFALVVGLTVSTCPTCQSPGQSQFDAKTIRGTRGLLIMVLIQYVAGAFLRHTESGGIFMIALLLHVLVAIGILVSAFSTGMAVIRQSKDSHINFVGYSVLILVLAQLVMGLMVLISGPGTKDFPGQPPIAYVGESVGHVLAGAMLLGAAVALRMLVRERGGD